MAFVLFSLLCILPILSGLCLYLSGRGVCLSLKGTRASCRCGQEMEVTIEMEYPLIPPAGKVWVELICENRVFGIRKELSCLLEPGNGRRQEYRLSLDTSLCGNLSVRAERLFCHDPLGLFSSKRSPKKEFLYTVYPFEVPMYVSLNRNREREQTGDIYDGRKSGTDVSEVFGLREYREGDPLQSIHWKLSGKMKQLIVREFGRPVNYHTLILLAPAFVYGEKEVGWEIAGGVFDLGVSLSRALLSQDIAHFVGYFSGGTIQCVPVDSLRGHEEMLLGLMDHPLQKNGDEVLLSFLDRQLYRQYTKVVYVAGAVHEAVAGTLSGLVDFSVLLASENSAGYLSGNGGYTTVGLPVGQLRSGEFVIPL